MIKICSQKINDYVARILGNALYNTRFDPANKTVDIEMITKGGSSLDFTVDETSLKNLDLKTGVLDIKYRRP